MAQFAPDQIHLRNMTALTDAGAVVFAPVPAFYAKPESLGDIVDHPVSRALDQFGLDTAVIEAWRAAA